MAHDPVPLTLGLHKPHFIEVKKLAKTYRTSAGDFQALKGIDLRIAAGEFVAVVGKSGSGKSTLINMLSGIDRPTSGQISIGGTAIQNFSEDQMAAWRGRNLGIIFQFFQLLPTLTLAENVMMPMDLNNTYPGPQRRARALELLERVGLADQADKLPSAVSGGQQQRAAIARALVNDPPLLVADEPTGNLDTQSAQQIFALFRELVSQGKTIVMVTHDDELARQVDRMILISDGEVVNESVVQAFSAFAHEQILEIIHKVQPSVFPPGATIVRQGESGDSFYIITRGTVDVFIQHSEGHQIWVNQLHEGQYFGEMALAGNGLRTSTVRASTEGEVSIVSINASVFHELLGSSHAFREQMRRIVEIRQLKDVLSRFKFPLTGALAEFDVQVLAPGVEIYHQGTIGEHGYYLVEGRLQVIVQQPGQDERVVSTLEKGNFFGELALLENQRRDVSVRVAGTGPARIISFDAKDIERLVDLTGIVNRGGKAGE
jgi:ABC-type lipoprotein export system ATPase subunit